MEDSRDSFFETQWKNTEKLLSLDNKKGSSQLINAHYRPEHKDFLFQILKDIKTSSTRYLTNVDSLAGNDSRNSSINGIIKLDSTIVSPVHSVKSNGIFQFPIFEKTTCLKVIREVLNIHKFYPSAPLNAGKTNSFYLILINSHSLDGIILNKFGFARKMPYFAALLGPLICKLYNLPSETIINTTQAIVVFYRAGMQIFDSYLNQTDEKMTLSSNHNLMISFLLGQNHKLHADDSDYTLNICLGLGFKGGKLEFAGTGSDIQNGSIEVEHRIGNYSHFYL
jgi:hypothetical protein